MAKIQEGYLLIADITGYTMYLSQSELDHAQEILAALLELLVAHTRPPLVLSRLAGDAVISYSLGGSFLQGQTFLEMIENTYVAFRKAIAQMVLNNTCHCKACANISSLDLKFFIHYGSFAIQHISDHDELVGSDVNLIHRLLKNHVTEKTGHSAYTLYTGAAIQQLGVEGLNETMTPLEEQYEHLGVAQVWVQDMHPIWQQKQASVNLSIPPGQVVMEAETEINLPPERVWDYLAQPEYRNILMGSERQEVNNLAHGRVAVGTVYQCVHGDHTVPLTILEWKPFERIVMHCPSPMPGTHLLSELRLEPTENGTRLVQLYSKATGPLPMRLVTNLALKRMTKQARADLTVFRDCIQSAHAGLAYELPNPASAGA